MIYLFKQLINYHLQNYTMMKYLKIIFYYLITQKVCLFGKKFSIANQSSSNNLAVGRREDFVFEELQSEYNIVSRNLTIKNREGNIEIVVDDDKVFGQNDSKKDTYGLKYTQHVKDNRKGYNCHVAATTCTLFPMGIR
jgi:hypothetical protein